MPHKRDMALEEDDQSQQEPVTYQAPNWKHANYFLTALAVISLALGVYVVKVGRKQSHVHDAPHRPVAEAARSVQQMPPKKSLPLAGCCHG